MLGSHGMENGHLTCLPHSPPTHATVVAGPWDHGDREHRRRGRRDGGEPTSRQPWRYLVVFALDVWVPPPLPGIVIAPLLVSVVHKA